MTDVYQEMMAVSERIADVFPQPRFYHDCRRELDVSKQLFVNDKAILRCREIVSGSLSDNYGHGIDHVTKVSIEAGALALIEVERMAFNDTANSRIVMLAQLAGLLHDLRRGEKDHAKKGALAAKDILDDFPVSQDEIGYIVQAIANHEAFVEPTTQESTYGQALSDVLYDADKFRWGPDNFTLTLWEMLRSRPVPVSIVIKQFPQGMAGIASIQNTFRSRAGKIFGPEFINLGLQIGERIYLYLQERFAGEPGSVTPA